MVKHATGWTARRVRTTANAGDWIDYSQHVNLTTDPIVVTLTDWTGDPEVPGLGDSDPTPGVIVDPSAPAFGPRGLLGIARADLQSLLPGLTDKNAKLVITAIAALDRAIMPVRWASPLRLVPATGVTSFNDVKAAVKALMSVTPAAEVSSVITDLGATALLLAENAIADARAAGGDTKLLGKAAQQLVFAAEDIAVARPDKAIDHYRTAWELAYATLN